VTGIPSNDDDDVKVYIIFFCFRDILKTFGFFEVQNTSTNWEKLLYFGYEVSGTDSCLSLENFINDISVSEGKIPLYPYFDSNVGVGVNSLHSLLKSLDNSDEDEKPPKKRQRSQDAAPDTLKKPRADIRVKGVGHVMCT
jgi:hypothetical protein